MDLPTLFTRAQALSAGWSLPAVDAEVRSGRWAVLRRGVYCRREDVPSDACSRAALDVSAAALATGAVVVGSHETAALVHGLPLFRPYAGPPVLSRVRAPRGSRPGQTTPAVLVSQVPVEHRVVVHGAVVTSPARTAVDLARKGPALSAVVVLDGALRAGVPRTAL